LHWSTREVTNAWTSVAADSESIDRRTRLSWWQFLARSSQRSTSTQSKTEHSSRRHQKTPTIRCCPWRVRMRLCLFASPIPGYYDPHPQNLSQRREKEVTAMGTIKTLAFKNFTPCEISPKRIRVETSNLNFCFWYIFADRQTHRHTDPRTDTLIRILRSQ